MDARFSFLVQSELDREKFPFSLISIQLSKLSLSKVLLLIALICKVDVVFSCVEEL